jgi:predicted type IV restriction endonuclease
LFIHQKQHFSSLHFKNIKRKVSQENQSKHDSKFKNSSRVTKNEKDEDLLLSPSPLSYTNS